MSSLIQNVIRNGLCSSFNNISPKKSHFNQWKYTRERLYYIRGLAEKLSPRIFCQLKALGIFRFRGCRGGGQFKQRPIQVITYSQRLSKSLPAAQKRYGTFSSNLLIQLTNPVKNNKNYDLDLKLEASFNDDNSQFNELSILKSETSHNDVISQPNELSIFVLNPTSLAKPHAIQQLEVDFKAYNTQLAVITETWFKKHHDSKTLQIAGFNLFRRDRAKRRGGGVCIYVSSSLMDAAILTTDLSTDNELFELLWLKVTVSNKLFLLGALYHPPKPLYLLQDFRAHIENCLNYFSSTFNDSCVIIAGDFNTLANSYFEELGLINIVDSPTHGDNKLDRIYVTRPIFDACFVVKANVPTLHKAIVATTAREPPKTKPAKKHVKLRVRTPSKNAALLNCLAVYNWDKVLDCTDTQSAFNNFYDCCRELMDTFYPLKNVTISEKDPHFITPYIKHLLRLKNNFSRKGQLEKADALAVKIGNLIAKNNTNFLNKAETGDAKSFWKQINQVLGKTPKHSVVSIDANTLNAHYAAISFDSHYQPPLRKYTCGTNNFQTVSEFSVFKSLTQLKQTASGPDGLEWWFIKLAAPAICTPLAYLFNLSLRNSFVPYQFKTSCITPVAKVAKPTNCSDYRPISITPILSRILEKIIVRQIINPALTLPPFHQKLENQFAFRPTGSTTNALIAIIADISNMLEQHEYVHVIALDFSKAFDTIRHSSLFQKLADLPIPDNIFNWLVSYFDSRQHQTRGQDSYSNFIKINASIVQGSAIGPSAFIITASDLSPIHPGNKIDKYADDSYLIVPGGNTTTIPAELGNIATWANNNNLTLNQSKTKEMIIRKPSKKNTPLPPIIPGISRCSSLNILGVTITDTLSMSEHVSNIVSTGHQRLYGLKLLKNHGLTFNKISEVCRSILVSRLTYASQAWRGFLTANDLSKLNGLVRKTQRWGVYSPMSPLLEDILNQADSNLFANILRNKNHVLHPQLPPVKEIPYKLRPKTHNLQLPLKTTLANKNFICRMIFNTI